MQAERQLIESWITGVHDIQKAFFFSEESGA